MFSKAKVTNEVKFQAVLFSFSTRLATTKLKASSKPPRESKTRKCNKKNCHKKI